MFTVELYAGIRRAVMVDGLSRREAAKRFGVHRNTITKMLQFSIPPGYRRRERPASKKLGPYMAWIDKVLEDDRSVHKKQRHTAHRIFERLRAEEGFSGGYTIVREYVARATLRAREMFVPLSHRPGQAQADFGQADAAETAEAFCEGHVAAFDFFGGVPLGAGRLCPAQLHDASAGRGRFDALNARFLDACVKRRQAILRGQSSTIIERMRVDTSAFLPLPPAPYDACHKVATRVSSLSLVRYRNNDYSVPTRHGHQEVLAKGYVDRVEIACRGETIAIHVRSYKTADFIYNPLHYLALLEHKSRALDQAAPLDGWRLAECIHRLRRLMEARMGNPGRREFIQVLRLMENFHQHQVEEAVAQALHLGAISFDAVKMLLLARLENRPTRLDLTFYPYLPAATVGATDPRSYLGLIANAGSIPASVGVSA